MASPDKLTRWLDLLAALLRRRLPATFAELRPDIPAYDAPGVRPESILRTFERDKDELRALGVAIESVQEVPGGEVRYRLRAEQFYLPFLLLGEATRPEGVELRRVARPDGPGYDRLPVLTISTDDHLALVRAALRAQGVGHPGLAADADAARRKLAVDLVDPELRATVAMAPGAARVAPAAFDLLGRALEARKVVAFTYHSIGRDVTGGRTAEPYGLVFLAGHWYLVARDVEAGALRRFRLSRLAAPRLVRPGTGGPEYTIPADFDLRAHARTLPAWELGDGEVVPVTVRFRDPQGTEAAGLHGGEALPAPPGVMLRRFGVRRVEPFLRWVLAQAGEARVVAPDEAVAAWQRLVARTRAAQAAVADGAVADGAVADGAVADARAGGPA
jgi:proteasome accessory factor B